MAKNECSSTYEGRHQTVMEDAESGDMVLVGDSGLHGVAFTDTDPDGKVVIDIAGRWYLPIENEVIAIGDALYCDATGGTLSVDPEHGTFFGYALEEADTPGTGALICVLVVQDHIPGGEEILLDMVERGDELEDLADAAEAVAGIVTAGVGASKGFAHDDAPPVTILVANAPAAGDRAVIVMVICNEVLGGTTPSEALIGETGDTDKFFDNATLSGMSAGEVLVTGGILTENKALIATPTDGVTNPTGEFTVVVLALPVGP